MTEKIISTESTGGEGFVFEKQVDAYFLVCLLNGKTPFEEELGPILGIEFQTRNKGWFFDDILLTLDSKKGTRRLALSVTSNKKKQFKSKAAPKDFVDAAWKQYLGEGKATQVDFDKNLDLLGLICLSVPEDVELLLKYIRERHSEWSYEKSNKNQQVFFDSFACPNTEFVQKYNLSEDDTVKFLKCIRVYDFDFNKPVSRWEKKALVYCRDALRDEERADDLWNELQNIADEYRPAGGYLSRKDLVDKVRFKFRLREFPDYKSAWKILQDHTDNNLNRIRDTIGGKVTIPRVKELEKLNDLLNQSKSVVLLGPPGCGKTVLAKFLAEAKSKDGQVIWLEKRDLKDVNFHSTESKLKYPVKEILASTTGPVASMIIDGLDRTYDEDVFRNLSLLMEALKLDEENSPWLVLVTCQVDEWNRVRTTFEDVNINHLWETLRIGVPDSNELSEIWVNFPQLGYLRQRLELQELLLNPKILDLLARNLSSSRSIDISRWVGESDLIEWFWNEVVCKNSEGQVRAKFLKRLASKQADDLNTETPLNNAFPAPELQIIDSLMKDGICRLVDERVSFDHPLYGDWVRQRILVGQANNLKQYLKDRIASPLWRRAVRLYGLHLLEQKGTSEWKSAFDLFDTEEERIIQYLLIESVIFAANSLRFLDNLWPILKADEGRLLHRLLATFRYEATQANPLVLKSARELGIDSETVAATIQRLPWIPYWRPMLRFLHKHLEEILEIDFVQILVVTVAYVWLSLPFPELDLRKEAAELALSIAERTRQKTKRGESLSEEFREGLYKAAPAAAGDLPGRFTRFALEASGRIAPIREGEVRKRRMTRPWPDGPKQRPDSAFQKVCLVGNDLNQAIISNPKLAQRLILALLIKPQRVIDDFYGATPLPLSGEMCQIQDDSRWPPPSFGWGPFLYFLENRAVEGLEVIIRLVNFAAQRWAENSKRPSKTTTILLPNGERELQGDVSVYYWYRDNTYAPGPVASALMALERWLYNKIDREEFVDEIIETILQNANSVAFAGVLSTVGHKKPLLFSDPLLPLLTVPEFLFWESRYYIGSGFDTPTMWKWVKYGEENFNRIQEWHTMPHREKGLDFWAFKLYGEEDTIRESINNAREKLIKRVEEEEDERLKGYLQNLTFSFDPTNWKEEKDIKDRSRLVFKIPEERRIEIQSDLQEREKRYNLMRFPYDCKDALKSDRPLPEEDIEEFWEFLQSVPERTQAIELPTVIAPIESSLCGGAAVLLLLHEEWLNKYPERKKWCEDQILQTFKKLYPPRRPDSDISWDKFCAHAIPKLWAENPDSTELREAVILFASDRNYSNVMTLFSSASRYRQQLGNNFKQLQNFILRWAGVRFLRDLSLRFLDKESLKKIKVTLFDRLKSLLSSSQKPYIRWKKWKKSLIDCHHWLSRAKVGFLLGSISMQIPTIDEVIVKRPARGKKLPYWAIKGVDITLINHAYGWLPYLDQAINEEERKGWIEFWKQALSYTTDIVKNFSYESHSDSDRMYYMNNWNRWLLANIASLVTQLKPEENPQDFWKPVLELSESSYRFTEEFLEHWFRMILRTDLFTEGFTREWRAMVEFAFTSPKWDYDSMEKWFDLNTLWCNLMGFGFPGMLTDISRDIWKKGSKELIEGMKDIYQRWAEEHLQRPRCATSFVLFLTNPAAEPLLFDGLIWFEKAASQADEHFWMERHLIDAVASLIRHCWDQHWDTILQNRETLNSFTKLVNKLAGFGNPVAMEIQSKMGRGHIKH